MDRLPKLVKRADDIIKYANQLYPFEKFMFSIVTVFTLGAPFLSFNNALVAGGLGLFAICVGFLARVKKISP